MKKTLATLKPTKAEIKVLKSLRAFISQYVTLHFFYSPQKIKFASNETGKTFIFSLDITNKGRLLIHLKEDPAKALSNEDFFNLYNRNIIEMNKEIRSFKLFQKESPLPNS